MVDRPGPGYRLSESVVGNILSRPRITPPSETQGQPAVRSSIDREPNVPIDSSHPCSDQRIGSINALFPGCSSIVRSSGGSLGSGGRQLALRRDVELKPGLASRGIARKPTRFPDSL